VIRHGSLLYYDCVATICSVISELIRDAQNAHSPQSSPLTGSRTPAVHPAVGRGRQQRDQRVTIGNSVIQAFQAPPPVAGAPASDVPINAVCGMRNSLLVAADSVTDAVSSLVKELNSGADADFRQLVVVLY